MSDIDGESTSSRIAALKFASVHVDNNLFFNKYIQHQKSIVGRRNNKLIRSLTRVLSLRDTVNVQINGVKRYPTRSIAAFK